ncbi:MAG: branched-chain amino acid ABC transporter permease [Betaproteobacteria bacterium]
MDRRYAGGALWLLILAAAPLAGDNYVVKIATFVALYGALALSWNFIGGYAGYPSFATAAFVGLGSYCGALCQNAGLPMMLAWCAAALAVAAVAAALGAVVLRLRGHYFAIASISLVEILGLLAAWCSGLTGGGEGLNLKLLPGDPDTISRFFLFAMLAIALAALVATLALERGRLGFALRCIAQNEDAAEMVGVATTRCKIAAFVLSGVFCGMAGAAYASWVAYIAPADAFSILLTVKVPVMVLLGGAGTLLGPLLGATVLVLLEETVWARFLDFNQAILGAVIVALIFLLPDGLLGTLAARRRPA